MSKCDVPKIGCVNHDCDNCKKSLNPYRNQVIEEVAQEIEKFTFAFGVDTVHSFVAFVRGMKE